MGPNSWIGPRSSTPLTFSRTLRPSNWKRARGWVPTASNTSSAKAAWAKSFAPSIRGWTARSPSRSPQEQFSALFEREARAIASLNHPNICTLYDVGPNYLVMELVEGETLAAQLKRGPLPMNTALSYASQIAAALAEAHAKDIVHRDLKPGNIMVARSSIKVLDFGLATSGLDHTVTASPTVMGTPGYMAPEQREGKPVDARTDIYAFGCVLYEMLAGARLALPRRRSRHGSWNESSAGASKRTPDDGGSPLPSCNGRWRRSRRRDAGLPWRSLPARFWCYPLRPRTSICTRPRNSPARTPSCSPSSPTPLAIQCSTPRCGKDSRFSSSSHRSSASSPRNASEERCR